jgi:hypothetical protein
MSSGEYEEDDKLNAEYCAAYKWKEVDAKNLSKMSKAFRLDTKEFDYIYGTDTGATNTCTDFDAVKKPSHYTEGRKFEPIDVIEDWKLGFNLGNAVKYISRAGRKDNTKQDLEKAIFYIQRVIKQL